jgi:hypothetical protein
MATQSVKDILDTEIPKPTFSLQPSRAVPVPSDVTVNRSSGAWTQTPTGLYEYKSAGQPRAYGGDQSLLVEGPQLTNYIDHREVGSGGWQQFAGRSATQKTGKTGIDGTPNAVDVGDDNSSSLEGFLYNHYFPTDNGYGFTLKIWVSKESSSSTYPVLKSTVKGDTFKELTIIFDTVSGVFEYVAKDGAATVKDTGSSWWEVTLTINTTGSGDSSVNTFIHPAYSTDGSTLDNSATGSIIVDAPTLIRHRPVRTDNNGYADQVYDVAPIMLDPDDANTSYPAQVVKNAESFFIETDSSWYNYDEGTIVVDLTTPPTGRLQQPVGNNSDSNGQSWVQWDNGKWAIHTAGNRKVRGSDGLVAASARKSDGRVQITHDGNTNGQLSGVDTTSLLESNLISIAGSRDYVGKIRSLWYYPKFLSQETREIITAQ